MSEAPDTTLETGAAAAEATDRRDMLAAQLDAVDTSPPEETLEEVAQRARDEKGRFAPSAAAEAATDAPAAPETPAEPDPAIEPPQSWKKEFHEAYTKADPQLRQYIAQREEEMRKGIEQVIPKAKFADEVFQAIQPFQQNLQASGLPPAQAIQALMTADNVLRNAPPEQKRAYAINLLREYGVDLGVAPPTPEEWGPPVDPRVNALQSELQTIKSTVLSYQQQQEASQQAALVAEIEAFSKDKPYFEAVRQAMSQLLTSGQAQSLEEAYERALEPWKPVLTEAERGRQAAEEADKRRKADEAAKAAKAAAVQVRSSTPGRAPQTKAQDRLSLLREQFDAVDSRV